MSAVKDFVFTCMDYRFRDSISKWIDRELNQADIVRMAGAAKALVDQDTRASALKQIKLAKQLHGIKTIHLIDHIDCGAYQGLGPFKNKEDEVGVHKRILAEASQLAKQQLPGLEIKIHLADFDSFVEL